MKKIMYLLLLGGILISACKKDRTSTTNTTQEKLLGKWAIDKIGYIFPNNPNEEIIDMNPDGVLEFKIENIVKMDDSQALWNLTWELKNRNQIMIPELSNQPGTIKQLENNLLIVSFQNDIRKNRIENHITIYYCKK